MSIARVWLHRAALTPCPSRECAAGHQRVDVRVPVQKFAVGLDGGDHAGHDVVAAELAPDFRLDARPGGRAQTSSATWMAVKSVRF